MSFFEKNQKKDFILLVTIFIFFSTFTIFYFRYLNKENIFLINNFFQENKKQDEAEKIRKEFSKGYWESVKNIISYANIIFFTILVIIAIIAWIKKRIFKEPDQELVKRIYEDNLLYQKNLFYSIYSEKKTFEKYKIPFFEKINLYEKYIDKLNKKILEAEDKKKEIQDDDSLGDKITFLNKIEGDINNIKQKIDKIGNLKDRLLFKIKKVFSKENIFVILELFLKSSSPSVNFYYEKIKNKSKEKIYDLIRKNDNYYLLPAFEKRIELIFFDNNGDLDDDLEAVKKRASEIVSLLEKSDEEKLKTYNKTGNFERENEEEGEKKNIKDNNNFFVNLFNNLLNLNNNIDKLNKKIKESDEEIKELKEVNDKYNQLIKGLDHVDENNIENNIENDNIINTNTNKINDNENNIENDDIINTNTDHVNQNNEDNVKN